MTEQELRKKAEHFILGLIHVDSGKVYVLPGDDSMTDEEIKNSSLFKWGNDNHYWEAVNRTMSLIKQAQREYANELIGSNIHAIGEKENEHGFSSNDFMTGYNQALAELRKKNTEGGK